MLGMILLLVTTVLVVFFGRHILAGISIIAGDKESLHHFGNLCEKEPEPPPLPRWYVEWQEQKERRLNYRYQRWHDDDEWRRKGEGAM